MASLTELEKDFKNLLDNRKLGHGYIFFGTGDSFNVSHENKKFIFAKSIARYCERRVWRESGEPLIDALVIDAIEESGIDIVRAATHFLWQKPILSERRTLIIHEAANLTLPAQQAILKIAEEPPVHALIILIVSDPSVLIQPLASRFQKTFFSINGSPSFLRKQKVSQRVKDFVASDRKRRSEIIKEVIADKRELDQFLRDMLIFGYKDPVKNKKLLSGLLNRIRLIKQFNTNKKLQLESVLLEIPIS